MKFLTCVPNPVCVDEIDSANSGGLVLGRRIHFEEEQLLLRETGHLVTGRLKQTWTKLEIEVDKKWTLV